MNIEMPLFLLGPTAVLALIGLSFIIFKLWSYGRILWLLRKRTFTEEKLSQRKESHLSRSDVKAEKILNERIKKVWRSTSTAPLLDPKILQEDFSSLIHEIAGAYFPESEKPEYEVTIMELLRLNQRITAEVSSLLSPFDPVHQISIASLIRAKSMFEHTRTLVDERGLKTGWKVSQRIWQGLNAMRPQYWLNRVLFKGATEIVGRKIIVSIYRIVGREAMNVYRSSSAITIDPENLPEMEEEVNSEETETKREETIQSQNEEPSEPVEADIIEETEEEIKKEEIEEEVKETMENDTKLSFKQRINQSIVNTFNKFFSGSLHLWDRLAKPEKIFYAYQKRDLPVESFYDIRRLPVEQIDEVAKQYITQGSWLSAGEGAATGFGGALSMAADAVSLLALQLRTIQQIGYCYGFDVTKPEEKLFAAKLLAEAYGHPAHKERSALLNEMRSAANLLKGQLPFGALEQRLFAKGLSKVAQKIGVKLGGRKTAQVIPVLGAVVGGVINRKVSKDIATIARDVYRDRLIQLRNENEKPENKET